MKLRNRFFIFAVIIHAIMLTMTIFLYEHNKTLFIISEGLIIFSMVITYGLFKAFMKPLNLMAAGIDP